LKNFESSILDFTISKALRNSLILLLFYAALSTLDDDSLALA